MGGGYKNKGLDKYLNNDRKVLSFDAVWEDKSPFGDMNFYKINYFLADDKVEVKEKKLHNSGKYPFPLLLKKSKLPKKLKMSHCPGMLAKEENYYT